MRGTITKQVSKMDVEIGKKHRELALLYEQRAKLMQKGFANVQSSKNPKSASEIDFPDTIMDELAKELDEMPRKSAKKTK